MSAPNRPATSLFTAPTPAATVPLASSKIPVLCSAGVPNATYRLMQHQFVNRRGGRSPTPMDHLVPPVQCLTNPENWAIVRQSMHAVGVAALLSLTHPVLIPHLASTSAVAVTAVHGVAAVYIQRAALASRLLSQQTNTRSKTLLSSVAASVLAKKRHAQQNQRQHLAKLDLSSVAMRMSHGATQAQSVAKSLAASLAGVAHQLKPLKRHLSTDMAAVSAPIGAVTVKDELIAATSARELEDSSGRGVGSGGSLVSRQRMRVPRITAGRVHTGSSLRCRSLGGQSMGVPVGRKVK